MFPSTLHPLNFKTLLALIAGKLWLMIIVTLLCIKFFTGFPAMPVPGQRVPEKITSLKG
jgi:hypothetical protein